MTRFSRLAAYRAQANRIGHRKRVLLVEHPGHIGITSQYIPLQEERAGGELGHLKCD